jgi:hypothetical protein
MPGMMWVAPRSAPLDDIVGRVSRYSEQLYPGATPDFCDPATVGCLLALVREALGEPTAHARPIHGGWGIQRDGTWDNNPGMTIWAKTEAEALVAALEAVSGPARR